MDAITASPALLDTLAQGGNLVTLDAVGCHIAIAARILAEGAASLLAVMANHGRAQKAVAKPFASARSTRSDTVTAVHDTFDDGPGRLVFAGLEAASLAPLPAWAGLHTMPKRANIRS